jgi:hypothetical protein
MNTQTVKTNIWNLKVGDVISFTNSFNYKVEIHVTRVDEKSWYGGIMLDDGSGRLADGRKSYGTLQRLTKYADFKIIRK